MFSSRKKMPAYANQQANVRIVVIIVDLFHQPISKKALLLYPSSFCLIGVDKTYCAPSNLLIVLLKFVSRYDNLWLILD